MKLIIVLALIWDAIGWGFYNAPVLLAAIIPIKSYSNVEGEKAQILKDKKNKSGTTIMMNNKNLAAKNSSYSSSVLYPNYITGFIDAEGSFGIYLKSNPKCKNGFEVRGMFQIGLHKNDSVLLENIKLFFNVGKIYQKKESLNYRVESQKLLPVIIDHFEKYPLISQKRADYILFKQAVELILRGEHLTTEGLNKIVAIKASMNRGLSLDLKAAFPDVIPVPRPLVDGELIPDPYWVAGFVEGEGCFQVNIRNSLTNNSGSQVQLRFEISQHSRDKILMENLVKFFGCGKYYLYRDVEAGNYIVTKLSDIVGKILPIFNTYQLRGAKYKNYEDFCKVVELVEKKLI